MIASRVWRRLMSTDGLDTMDGVPGCLLFTGGGRSFARFGGEWKHQRPPKPLNPTRSTSVIDSMTMSAPAPGVKLVVAKPTNRLGRKEPNDDHYRSRFPSRVSTNRFAQHHDRRGRGETAGTSRRGGEVLPCSRECGRDSAPWHGGQWARTLVRASDSRVAV